MKDKNNNNANKINEANKPFWETKSLQEMTRDEWELLCDGCGKCCLCKLESDKTGEIFYTNVCCRLLDLRTCRCRDYKNRLKEVAGCIKIDKKNIHKIRWLPETCAYQRLYNGKELYRWHHLISGDRNLIHRLGLSVLGKVVSEETVSENDLPNHVYNWPLTMGTTSR